MSDTLYTHELNRSAHDDTSAVDLNHPSVGRYLRPDEAPIHGNPGFSMSGHIPKVKDKEKTIFDEAQEIVEGQRRDDYGDARTCFNRIAKMWAGYLGVEVNAQDVAHLMIMLKIARNHDTFKRDSLVDVCGYAYCADLIHDQELAESSKFNGEY